MLSLLYSVYFLCLFTPSESVGQDLEKEHNGGTENITDRVEKLFHMVYPPNLDLYSHCIIQIFPKAMSYRLFVTVYLFTSNHIGIIIIISY